MILNAETIRGEGRWHFVDEMTMDERRAVEELDIETAFCGGSSAARARRAMELIAAHLEDPGVSCPT